jgi:SAM-dependent methyltransferase
MILYVHTDERLCIGRLFLNHNAIHHEAATKLVDVGRLGGGARRVGGPTQEMVMPFYRDNIYPHLVDFLGNPKPIQEIRERIVPLAEGNVLEIGVGPGVNFVHYDPGKVNKVYALEPNPGMLRRAEKQRRKTTIDVEFLDLPGERIPLADASVDTAVSTFSLCTIPGVVEAIAGINRILKPGGKFLFFEHGLAPETSVQRWQRRTEPLFRWVFEGCHVTRDIPDLVRQGGFTIEKIDSGYVSPFPKSGSYCWWGVAVPNRG